MKRFSWILTLPLIVVAVIFAIANREPITLDLWPLEASPRLPLFVILLACVGFGVAVGGLATWLSAAPARQRARQARRRVAELEREAARRVTAAADSGRPGQPELPAPAPAPEPEPEPKRRSALGR